MFAFALRFSHCIWLYANGSELCSISKVPSLQQFALWRTLMSLLGAASASHTVPAYNIEAIYSKAGVTRDKNYMLK